MFSKLNNKNFQNQTRFLAFSHLKKTIRSLSSNMITMSNLVTSRVFYSVISLCFISLITRPLVIHSFIRVMFACFSPQISGRQLQATAVKFLLFYPLTVSTVSTSFIDSLASLNKPITMPTANWFLVDRFCVRVLRPFSPVTPGLDGTVELEGSNGVNLFFVLSSVLTEEFIISCFKGTPLQPIIISKTIPAVIDEMTGDIIEPSKTVEFLDKYFLEQLDYELKRFDTVLYSEQYFKSLDSYFVDLNVCFRHDNSILMSYRLPRNLESQIFGAHRLRNCEQEDKYFIQHSHLESYSTEETQTLILCFLFLFKPKYLTRGKGLELTTVGGYAQHPADLVVNLDSFDYFYILKSFYSIRVITSHPSEQTDGDRPEGKGPFVNRKGKRGKQQVENTSKLNPAMSMFSNNNPPDGATVKRGFTTLLTTRKPVVFYDNMSQSSSCWFEVKYKWPVLIEHIITRSS